MSVIGAKTLLVYNLWAVVYYIFLVVKVVVDLNIESTKQIQV